MYYLIKRHDKEFKLLVITEGDRTLSSTLTTVYILTNTKDNWFYIGRRAYVSDSSVIDQDESLEALKERALLEVL